jgi:uncharacterized protein YcaQ
LSSPPDFSLSARQARRVAIAAQGFRDPDRAADPTPARLKRLIGDLGVVQLDSVNVLSRSHYLPAFSRLGAYPRERLDDLAWGRKPALFEYWGHEASLMPLALHPLLRWRMARARDGETWSGLARFGRERQDLIAAARRRVGVEGPLTGGDFASGPKVAGWWNWSDGKRALEWLFWAGEVTTRTRRGFERVYDLTERVIPSTILDTPTPDEAEAHRGLLRVAARALGVATAADLRDYFRLPSQGVAARLAELVEAGDLATASVEGWRQPAFLDPNVGRARLARVTTLLSPFDNLIWSRDRAERLFGARIRLEIYTPAHLRRHGYYVLPLLAGGAITARVDLKADRKARRLLVQAAHLEAGAPRAKAADDLFATLRRLADWLGLDTVRAAP